LGASELAPVLLLVVVITSEARDLGSSPGWRRFSNKPQPQRLKPSLIGEHLPQRFSHGSRRGLYSYAAPRLVVCQSAVETLILTHQLEALRYPKADLFRLRAGLLHHFYQDFSGLRRVAHFS
jgi:hypothetical protein